MLGGRGRLDGLRGRYRAHFASKPLREAIVTGLVPARTRLRRLRTTCVIVRVRPMNSEAGCRGPQRRIAGPDASTRTIPCQVDRYQINE